MSKELNIYEKLNKVRETVPYIKKDKKVQGYQAVTHDQVTAHIHDACVDNGIFIIPDQVSGESTDSGMRTSSGNPITLYKAEYKISFVNMTTPDDKLEITVQSHANDTSDKAPGKALSYAVKYAALKVLMLETGENEESRVEGERAKKEKISDEHVKWIKDAIEEYEIDEKAFYTWLSKNRVKEIEDINVVFFKEVERMILAKKPKEEDKGAE